MTFKMATSSETINIKFWTAEKEQILIDMWSQSACLFLISSPEYSDRNKKHAAMLDIAQTLETTVDDIKKKMSSFRAAFNRARRPPPSGSSANKKSTKKDEWLIKNLDFLNASSGNRVSTSYLQASRPYTPNSEMGSQEVEDELSDIGSYHDDDDDDDVFSANDSLQSPEPASKSTKRPLPTSSRKKTAKQKRNDEEMSILKSLAKSLDTGDRENDQHKSTLTAENDPCSAFGQYVTQTLAAMNGQTRLIAMNNIQNAIFQAQMAQFQPSPCVSSIPLAPYNQGNVFPKPNNVFPQPNMTNSFSEQLNYASL